METSSQMAENNFNFLQNIPICTTEEKELLLTALENGKVENDQEKIKTSQKHSNAHLSREFTLYTIYLSILEFQKCTKHNSNL